MKVLDWAPSKTKILLPVILAAGGAGIYLRSQSPVPTPISMPAAESFLIIVGTQDAKPTTWDGCITVSGANVLGLNIWRLGPKDSVTLTGTTPICPKAGSTFQLQTIDHSGVGSAKTIAENGVILTISAADPLLPAPLITLGVTTRSGAAPDCSQTPLPPGCYQFSPRDLPFGTSQRFPQNDPKAGIYVARTAAPLQLTGPYEDEDFPTMARSGDDVWVAYIQFRHNQPLQQQPTGFNPKNLPAWLTGGASGKTDWAASPLARPAGGDRVFAMHYSISGRQWTGPFAITGAVDNATMMGTAVAVDGQKRAWIFYSVERNGVFNLYAKRIGAGGTVSAEMQVTNHTPGPDLFPVATTDSNGHVWVAWQGFRNGNLEILAVAQQTPGGNTFTPEALISASPASDWDPAIAAGPSGDVGITWDTYNKGDYDVYFRRTSLTPAGISLNPARPIAASLGFEARSSVAIDKQNRVWIAYETADQKWGKDFGALDTSGINLYQNHNVAVRVIDGTDLKSVTNDNLTGPGGVMPGPPNSEFFTNTPAAPSGSFPDPNLAIKRAANGSPSGEASYPKLPNNSVPRIAVDDEGTVYLGFRTRAGAALSLSHNTGQGSTDSVGTIWIEQMVYFDGQKWSNPGVLALSDGLLDSRPVILPLDPGHLLFAQVSDHRLSPAPSTQIGLDPVNSDIYASELIVDRRQQGPPQLTLSPAVIDPPSADEKGEAAQVALINSTTISVGGATYQVKRGDFHRHTQFSFDGGQDGSIQDAYRYMIDAAPLDWGGCCDHDNGSAREYSWWNLQKYTEAYLLAGRYTPLFNYERSLGYPDGHRNAIFATRGIRPLPRLPKGAAGPPCPQCPPGSPDTYLFYSYLHYFNGLDAAHTSATDQGNDWSSNDPAVETTVEIYQGDRQAYEKPESARANSTCDSIDEWKPLGYVSAALKPAAAGGKSYMLGFESSSDHRSTHISYTNVWLTDPSRQGTIDAISRRRVYASTDLIYADVRMGDHFMGESFTWTGTPTLNVTLIGTAPFQEVAVVKDSVDVFTTNTARSHCNPLNQANSVCFSWQDTATLKSGEQHYYYIRGVQTGTALPMFTCETTQRTQGGVVWTSPMWVTEK